MHKEKVMKKTEIIVLTCAVVLLASGCIRRDYNTGR